MGGIGEILVVVVLARKSRLGWQKPDLACVRILCEFCGGRIRRAWTGRRGGDGVAGSEFEEDSVLLADEVGAGSEDDTLAGA